MKRFKRNQAGVSIIETLIYIAILVFILVVVVTLLFNLLSSQKNIKAAKSIENSASLSLERIIRETRLADSVDTSTSVFGSSNGKLVLNTTDTSGNARTVEFYLSGTSIHLKDNGADQGALTQNDVRVTSLKFTQINGDNSTAVRTEMTLQSGTTTSFRSDNFYTTDILRSSI